jgi:hypothetical protein
MTRREQQFVQLFAKYRLDDQARWYSGRIDEYTKAKSQIVTLTGVLLFAAGAAGVLASFDVGGVRVAWAVVASIFSALSTALTAYDTLIGFDHTTKLYEDAVAAVDVLRADVPDARTLAPDDREAQALVDDFVNRVEAVFRKEGGQWGQLIASSNQPQEDGSEDR